MAATELFNSVSELLPHRGDMILLDHITSWGEDYVEATVLHRGNHLFTDPDGNVPAWVGIEYMAQAIAALAGIRALREGRPIRIGFLLGTRKYESHIPYFKRGIPVTIRAERVLGGESDLVVFDCNIQSDKILAEAQIKAMQPDNLEGILKNLTV